MNGQNAARVQSDFASRARDYLKGRIPYPQWLLQKRQRPFSYPDDIQIANGASGRLDIKIHDDADFVIEAVQIISSLQTAAQDLATVQITDTTSAMPWSNVAVPLRDLAGKGDSTKYLSDPNIVRPTSTVAVQITVHGDHLFYDDAMSKDPALRFADIALADADGDGRVTEEELSAYDIRPLPNYQVGSLDIYNLFDFIAHMTTTLGHIWPATASAPYHGR